MRALYLFLFLLFAFLLLPAVAQAQNNLSLSTTPIQIDGVDSVTFQIPADLDTFVYTDITFFLEGGDGGKAERGSSTGRSGDGAQVSIKFPLGRGANALRPGGLIRFVIGSRGQNAGGGSTSGGAGGGGGTAILYKDPGVSHSGGSVPTLNLSNSINYGWTLLGVAGGGGGGYVDANGRSNGRPGQSGTSGSESRSTGGNSNAGGSNGAAGVDQNDGSGAGCGYLTTGGAGNNSYNGLAGGITGRQGDDFANRSGGFGYGPGGHGQRLRGGGGGGGFSGGGSGRNSGSAGGGGGSFASSASTATTITQNDDNNSPDDGLITYTLTEDLTPGPAPNVSCVASLNVVVNDGGETTVTGLELDNGSTDPLDGDLSYTLCFTSFGEYICFDERNFDCSDVGETQDWYLGVENSAERSICSTPTAITIVEGTTTLPTCPPNRTVSLNSGCIGTVSVQQIRPISTGDCSDLDVSLTLPNAQVVNNPPDFFEGLYEFIAGTTQVTFTNTVGSCSFNVTVNAGFIPNLNCPSDRTFEASNNQCGRNISNSLTELTDDGIGVTYRLTNEALGFTPITGTGNLGDFDFPRGVSTVEYFLEDAGGCVSDCSFTITIEGDPEDGPVVNCADNLVVEYSPALTTQDILDLGILSVTDDCGISEIRTEGSANLSCNRIGDPQIVTVEVLDIDGNSPEICEIGFTLTETTPPTMRCVEPYTVAIPASGPRIVRPDQVDDGSTSECDFDLDIQGTSNGNESFNCNDLGENLVTLVGTNREGNEASATCTTTITVIDDRAPDPVCQNITLILSELGNAFLAPTSLDGGSSDNCTITDFSGSKTSFNCDDLGANTVTLTMADQSGNSSNCTSTVTILDSPNRFCDQDAFATTWVTSNPNQTITIPTDPALTYDYEIEWGDGSPIQTRNFGDPPSHEYAVPGEYQIRIRGVFPRIVFASSGASGSIRSIDQWGTIQWADMWQAFEGCSNLRILATDAPDLSQVTSLGRMFRSCGALESPDLSNWETGTITNMPFMFFRAYNFNGDITTWDVGNVNNFNFTFDEAVSFDQNISGWNIGENVTGQITMFAMFEQTQTFDQPIGSWDMSKVSTISFMFKRTGAFNQPLAAWQTGAIPQMEGTFDDATAFDQDLGDWDISGVANMKDMLNNSGMSIANYDATLMGWSGLANRSTSTPPFDITFGAANLDYCDGEAARTELATTYRWIITDGIRNCILPVTLTAFTGEVVGKTNVLSWSTEQEEGFSHFEVERSSAEAGAQRPDASAEWWVSMGAVAGAMGSMGQGGVTPPLSPGGGLGERSYTFTDATPQRHNYYRLRMVDLDGSFSYSPVIYLQNPLGGSASSADELRVFPNPNAGTFHIALPEVAGEMDLAVYTIHGTRVRAQKIGAGTTNWRMEDELPAGIFLVSVTALNGERWTKRVVVR